MIVVKFGNVTVEPNGDVTISGWYAKDGNVAEFSRFAIKRAIKALLREYLRTIYPGSQWQTWTIGKDGIVKEVKD